MADIIKLGKVRKARKREAEKAQADENAVKFGRSKAERLLEATRSAKAQTSLDRHKVDEDNEL